MKVLQYIFAVIVMLAFFITATYMVGKVQYPDLLPMILPQYFAKEDTGPDPSETLTAPFAHELQRDPDAKGLPFGFPETSTPLSQPHRSTKTIGDWILRAMSEVFSVNVERYDNHLVRLETGLTEDAITQYDAFMDSSNLKLAMRSGGKVLRAVVERPPVILNSGEIEGRYRWLYDVYMSLTLIDPDEEEYTTDNMQTVRVIIRVQVGRSEKGGVDGILLESFDVRSNSDGEGE